MQQYLGQITAGICQSSSYAANGHIGEIGISGSGKSSRGQRIELEASKNGATVIVIENNDSHAGTMIYPPIREEYLSRVNRIDAQMDGLNIMFLKSMQKRDKNMEDFLNLVNSATYALSAGQKMGIRQIGRLREAVIFAAKNRQVFHNEMVAIKEGLCQQNDAVSQEVYYKLWTVLNSGIFRPSKKGIKAGAINIISFSGMDKLTQATLTEITLSYLWRVFQYRENQNNIILSIDEFQNIPFSEGSVLRDMLREGRKFGINLLLITQTLDSFSKDTLAVLNQIATWLYFQCSLNEARRIARMIAPMEAERWREILLSLQIGEAVTIGNLCIGTREIKHPIITR